MDNVTMLTGFSLTRQEATVYLELLKGGQMTGYEVSKRTGISRSNVYTALSGLVEKGASDIMEGEPTYYIPVPIDSFCESKLRNLTAYKKELVKSCERPQAEFEGFATIRGGENVKERLKSMTAAAEYRIYISAGWALMQELKEELSDAVKNGLRVVIITPPPFELYGAQVYHSEPSSQIRLIIDNNTAVTGEYDGSDDGGSCLYSGSEYLKELVKDALKNDIRTITSKRR